MTTSKSDTPNILIIAGEASSALYAQRLLEHWQREGQDVQAFGVGSESMERLGFERLGRSEEMSVVGFQEVLAHYSDIKAVFHRVLEEVRLRQPRAALLLDYPGFNLRLAKKLKAMGIPVVYYISPQVWAWKKGRIHDIKKTVDKMLVLFPFEVDFYQQHQVDVEFVGHPLLDELDDKFLTDKYRYEHRSRYGLKEDDLLLGLMPGSRRSELKHHLQTQIEVATRLREQNPGLRVALFVAPGFSKSEIRSMLPNMDFPLMLIQDEPFEMIHLADVILCASGTATLMVGLLEKPMVIMYRMNPLTAFLAKRIVTTTKYFGMINLILDEMVAPEFFQERASVDELSLALKSLLDDPSRREQVKEKLRQAKTRLGEKGATLRVAEALQEYLGA